MSSISLHERLSQEAECILNNNGITDDILRKFCNDDIEDLFRNCKFMDRFHLREFVTKSTKNLTQAQAPIPAPIPAPAAAPAPSPVQAPASSSTSNYTSSLSSAKQYNAEDMLKKKNLRGKALPGQKAFSTLIKDCATGARIWKKAPPLSTIPSCKRESFFENLFSQCPHLKGKETEIWRNLGEKLQNRRKYLSDLEKGKRKRTGRKQATASEIPTYQGSSMKKQIIKEGDLVRIINKNRLIIGDGIYLHEINQDSMFCKIVVKSLKKTDEYEELPFPVDGATQLDEKVLKTVITWRKERLLPATKSSKDVSESSNILINSASGDTASEDTRVVLLKETLKPSAPTKSNCPKKRSTSASEDKQNSVSTAKKKVTSSPTLKSLEPSVSENGQSLKPTSSSSVITVYNASSSVINIYEWSRGNIYFGIEKNGKIVNCKKAIGVIDKGHIRFNNLNDQRIVSLNQKDIVKNPNKKYLVMSCANENVVKLTNNDDIIEIVDEDSLRYELTKCIIDYVQ